MSRFKAVLWDMDGTLIDSEEIAIEAFRRAMVEAGLPVVADLHRLASGRAADDLYGWLVTDYGLTVPRPEWELRKLHHHFGAIEGIRTFPSAIAAFTALDSARLPQAIVSNSDRMIMDTQLRLADLARPGRITVSRNDLRRGKPDPEGYLRAAWLLEADPAECLVVEDSLSGAAAGLAAGMTTVFVPHATVRPPKGVHPLADMADLTEFLAAVA